MAIQDMRRDYRLNALREQAVAADPMAQFGKWFEQAVAVTGPDGLPGHEAFEPNAMTLATCTRDGTPSARIVLLKGFDQHGFVFYGNYDSQKGRELAENPVAALLLHWAPLERQVRISGRVVPTSRAEAEAYFRRRPRASQLGALASPQSRPVPDRETLERQFDELARQYPDPTPIPMPQRWGGWRLTPDRFEFWQGQTGRLHDRLVYTRQADDRWALERLAP